jgi:hypothetical protein
MVAGILLQIRIGAHVGAPSRLNTPYDAVAEAVAGIGFRHGTIVAGPGPLGGNLRLAFPEARVVSLEAPDYLPPRAAGSAGGECLVAWDRDGGAGVPELLRAWLEARFGAQLSASLPVATVTVPPRHAPGPQYRAFYVRLPQGAGRCR